MLIRNSTQVKTHAQLLMKKKGQGKNIFQELDDTIIAISTAITNSDGTKSKKLTELSSLTKNSKEDIVHAARSLVQMKSTLVTKTQR